MTSSEKHDCLEALYEELSAIQHTMNRREAEICRAINTIR